MLKKYQDIVNKELEKYLKKYQICEKNIKMLLTKN